MTRASGTTRGSAVSSPGTSFQSETREAPSPRASSVAVRSEPPRPSVATSPSGVAPMKPGTIGTMPRASSGSRVRWTLRSVRAKSGAAWPNAPSVWTRSMASTYFAFVPAASSAAATRRALSRSPRDAR